MHYNLNNIYIGKNNFINCKSERSHANTELKTWKSELCLPGEAKLKQTQSSHSII